MPEPMTDFPVSVRTRALPVRRVAQRANGVAGAAGITNGQPIDSSGGSVSQQALVLAVPTPPPGTVAARAGFGMTVSVENSQGHVDTSFDGPVTAVLSTDPDGATLGGTVTMDAQNGVAVFSGLTVNMAGGGYAIEASSGGVTSNADQLVRHNRSSTATATPPSGAARGDGITWRGPEQEGRHSRLPSASTNP